MSTQNADSLTLTFPSDRETVITRIFAAPRALVFAAMTQPEHVRPWYGLHDHTMKVCEIDLRVGGKWRYVMQMPDGNEFAFSGEYLEIVPNERLVATEWFEAIPGADYVATVTFNEQDGQTTLTNHLRYKSPEHRDGHVNSGMEWGMRETFARLDAQLVEMAIAAREIVLTRIFDAPRELVFQAWTDPVQIEQWWGPAGFHNETLAMDVRPGGTWRYIMHGPDGTAYDNRTVYREVVAPERLVYWHGWDVDDDPLAFTVTVIFEAVGKQTNLTMRMRFATAEQREDTIAFGAIESGRQTLTKLAQYLTKLV